MKDNSIFDEALKNDKLLQYLANYEVTGGNIIFPKTQEEIDELSTKIANKFNYFKKLIRDGECTLDFISENVFLKNGAFVQSKKNIDDIYKEIVDNNSINLNESDENLINELASIINNTKKKK